MCPQGVRTTVARETSESGADLMTPTYVLKRHLGDLETVHGNRWRQTPDRSERVRKILNGDEKPPIPESFARIGDVSAFTLTLPHQFLVPYHLRNTLSKDPPRVKRWPRGVSIPANSEATKIEQAVQAVMDNKYRWRDSVDILQNDGFAVALVLPDPDALKRSGPSIYKADGKAIDERYERDAKGRSRDEAGAGFRVSHKASAKAHREDVRDLAARNIPLTIELLPPTSIIPGFGPSLDLDFLIVSRYWTVSEVIRAGFRWDGDHRHFSPDGSAVQGYEDRGSGGGSGSQIKVTELYAVDHQDDGPHPYLAYFCEGKPTRWRRQSDTEADALIDFRKEYGMRRLPVARAWGPHWATADPDKRAMPFSLPFADAHRAVNAMLTAGVVHAWLRGFPILLEQVDPSKPDLARMAESPDGEEGDAGTILDPFSIVRVNGPVTELGAGGMSPDFYKIIDLALGSAKEEGPPNAAFGGGGESGFQASLARAYADDALDDLKDGALELYRDTASLVFEVLTGIANRTDPVTKKPIGSVPIERITKVPIGGKRRGTSGGRVRDVVEITKDMAGGLFDMDAEYPPTPNLARGAQLAEFTAKGLALRREFREQVMGDPNWEVFEAELLDQRIRDMPGNIAQTAALAAEIQGDEDMRDRMLALARQEGAQGADGYIWPSEALSPDQPGAGGPPGTVPQPGGFGNLGGEALTGEGMGGFDPGQQSLAGAIGGAMAAPMQAASAGGYVPPDLSMGGM